MNLYIPFPDYIVFCERIKYYLSLPKTAMKKGPMAPEGCPTGILEDVRLVFVHYATFELARDKWFERARRVDMGNLFFMLTQRDGCTDDDVRMFGELPHTHKVAFTRKPFPGVPCACYIPGFVYDGTVKVLTEYTSRFSGRRIIDAFDYVRFLNGK